jgi:4-alpha-glucanotransferase
MMRNNERLSGILLHPTSLPSPYGIGDLGRSAYEFVDFLEKAGQHLWQILPLTHTGYGDSPYQSFSAYAGQPLLISPDHLEELGLIRASDLADVPQCDPEHIDYGRIIPWKQALLEKAYSRFKNTGYHRPPLYLEFARFTRRESFWLDDYALFMACKSANNGASWLEWEDCYRIPTEDGKAGLRDTLSEQIGFYQFIQFIFYKEWLALKSYANDHGVRIIGDIPIFVSMDSADVWANRHLFQLDPDGYPLKVAGVPPDYFSATGQLWGNPLYNWKAHEEEGFSWWISRIRHQMRSLDILRIDHFRGFESYWSIPYGEKTAINGEWIPAPGYALFEAVQKALGGDLPIIAEDLGIITPEVDALRRTFCFPGMKVLQFAFDSLDEGAYLPHRYADPDCVCYTGTHDNDTSLGWYLTLRPECQHKVCRYTHCEDAADLGWCLIRTALGSIAGYAVFPLQDVLGYGSKARMNTPGTASGNWDWRFRDGVLRDELAEALREVTVLYGRH